MEEIPRSSRDSRSSSVLDINIFVVVAAKSSAYSTSFPGVPLEFRVAAGDLTASEY